MNRRVLVPPCTQQSAVYTRFGALLIVSATIGLHSACDDASATLPTLIDPLRACGSDSESPTGVSCVCGACTKTCDQDSVCDAAVNLCAKAGSAAFRAACSPGEHAEGICLHKCVTDDCPRGTCVEGVCVPGAAGGDGGHDADGSLSDRRVADRSPSGSGGTGTVEDAAPDRAGPSTGGGGAILDAKTDGSLEPPSCRGLAAECGFGQNENCCTTLRVRGGSFYRSYDAVTHTDMSYPATVSDFRLDKFEVTVGRFRKFVDAWVVGWRVPDGAGKHVHLNGGKGLQNPSGGYEGGWSSTWATYLPPSKLAWDSALADGSNCSGDFVTWTIEPGENETLPIHCVSWAELSAFCIWDGGFLPSEAEWNYAAAGGSEQRVYPWSDPPTSTTIDCSYACLPGCQRTRFVRVGSQSPKGDGRFGQSDLMANVRELMLDAYDDYAAECRDCANTTYTVDGLPSEEFTTVRRGELSGNDRWPTYALHALGSFYGGRCARSP